MLTPWSCVQVRVKDTISRDVIVYMIQPDICSKLKTNQLRLVVSDKIQSDRQTGRQITLVKEKANNLDISYILQLPKV